jgi:fibrillin 2/3
VSLCACKQGFQGPSCGQPVCNGGCSNGGRCTAPDQCSCSSGFSGDRCETDLRTGPCFTQIQQNMCRGQLTGVVCTRALCCATVGKAWGIPCEQCPDQPDPCRRGFMYNPTDRKCLDVNECVVIPGLCVGGRCVNSIGSYSCECEEGQRRNQRTGTCEDIDECASVPGVCAHGECHNTEGGFFCVCNEPGYELSPDKKRCIPSSRLGNCYSQHDCQRAIPEQLSLRDCCCTIGKGWSEDDRGRCIPCPHKTAGKND